MESEQVGSSPDATQDLVVAAEAGSRKFQNSTPETHRIRIQSLFKYVEASLGNPPWCWYLGGVKVD
jgi:hypothetical protein